MRKVACLLAVAFFLLNPGFACGPAGPEFQYGASEMKAAVEGDWSVTITPDGGSAMEYGVHLQQAAGAPSTPSTYGQSTRRALVRAAHACGTRTLVSSASACVDLTELPLTVTLAASSPAVTGTPTALYRVVGLTFTTGDLDLVLGPYHVSAQIKPDGTVSTASLAPGGPSGMAALQRM